MYGLPFSFKVALTNYNISIRYSRQLVRKANYTGLSLLYNAKTPFKLHYASSSASVGTNLHFRKVSFFVIRAVQIQLQ